MSVPHLKRLRIEHLRGCITPFSLSFEKGKKLTIIYGENGTGKTTLCDAFEFLAKGTVGSLERRGLGHSLERFWPSIGKNVSDVVVTIETEADSCCARVLKGNVVVDPAGLRPRVEVLRKSQILSLLEAQPAERYTAISRFIDVSGVENSETALRDLIRRVNGSRDLAVVRVQENEDGIRRFWETAGKPGSSPLEWADAELKKDASGIEIARKALSELRRLYQLLQEYSERLDAVIVSVDLARKSADDSSFHLQAKLKEAAEDAGELVGLLETARAYLVKHPGVRICPLCESGEKVTDLQTRVDAKLLQFSELHAAVRAKSLADQKLKDAENAISALKSQFERDRSSFEKQKASHDWRKDVRLPSEMAPEAIDALPNWIEATKGLTEHWLKVEAGWQDQAKFLATLGQSVTTYRDNVKAQKELDIVVPRLSRALEICIEERRRFTDEVLKAIANEVGRLYELVHPGEGLNQIGLELDASRRASLQIGASFAGQANTPPQAYFSQSHLDTLGLCVFLALSALDNPSEVILVLDDVLASVDEPHVDRLVEMLFSEATKFRHCIITTHYKPFKQKLRWGWLKNGQCHFIELTRWDLSQGLQLIQSVPDIGRLRQLLAETPPDCQLVCAKAGVVLEAVLDFLTQLYECAVPRRPNSLYTIGDLLPAINRKLRQALTVEVLLAIGKDGKPVYEAKSLTPILEELVRIAQARNVFGAHFNELSFQMLDADAITFGNQVLMLAETMVDPVGGWPKSAKSGSYWATANESRRLHPLQQPD